MEVSGEEKLDSEYDRLNLDFQAALNLERENSSDDEVREDEDEDEEQEEEFSFINGGELPSPVAAEDAFSEGRIKTVFPLFNQGFLLPDDDPNSLIENLPIRPAVKVFVETSEGSSGTAASAAGESEISGPYCEWSDRKAVEASEQGCSNCKKSNSTGFSKIWRLKELRGKRSNSDGRDAFVFLNSTQPPKKKAEESPAAAAARSSERKEKGKRTTALSAHEVYLKSKAKAGKERRTPTYLPYRPELVGFFTTLNGGLTKNVHPF
ncbi:uncharacterized protein LOC127263976 [Andrographis paniculata]|uniref:uncharacterized protein LOC127263976 n=1 Tax=Andrographis paniculata TaxID=175694 RepID=UPI0021E868ED|nr:uncharacterized protein LOC127263976 [Andrographis paniculata]